MLIDKTYKDAPSYKTDRDTIVFDRSLGIRRNSVVLPSGYALVSCNVPSQATPDGRVMFSFMNPGPPQRLLPSRQVLAWCDLLPGIRGLQRHPAR